MTKNIFIIGAGRSTPALIKYLVELSFKENIQLNLDNENKKEFHNKIIEYFIEKTKFFSRK